MSLLSVAEAVGRATAGVTPLGAEQVALAEAAGRVLAGEVAARRSQPPDDVSAMDGYAVRQADLAVLPAQLTVIGSAPAGHPFAGGVGPGEAVRIFTGAPVPAGADTIVIQENAKRRGGAVEIGEPAPAGRYIRKAGLDFAAGQVLLTAGRRLGPRDVALAASMNHTELPVRRRPLVAVLATGDELVPPGIAPGPGEIVASNGYGLIAFAAHLGAATRDLGIAPDDAEAIARVLDRASDADVIVTLGGASVGEHDLVRQALDRRGFALDFWRIAMRPGKPMLYGLLGSARVLGLPGNPVSSLVCAQLFLKPLIARLLGLAEPAGPAPTARLGCDLPANDERQDYLRARLAQGADGPVATPFDQQDSSMLALLAAADCFVIRPPHAPPARAGDRVEIMPIDT